MELARPRWNLLPVDFALGSHIVHREFDTDNTSFVRLLDLVDRQVRIHLNPHELGIRVSEFLDRALPVADTFPTADLEFLMQVEEHCANIVNRHVRRLVVLENFILFGVFQVLGDDRIIPIVALLVSGWLPLAPLLVSDSERYSILLVVLWSAESTIEVAAHGILTNLPTIARVVNGFFFDVFDLEKWLLSLFSDDLDEDTAFPQSGYLRVVVHLVSPLIASVHRGTINILPVKLIIESSFLAVSIWNDVFQVIVDRTDNLVLECVFIINFEHKTATDDRYLSWHQEFLVPVTFTAFWAHRYLRF